MDLLSRRRLVHSSCRAGPTCNGWLRPTTTAPLEAAVVCLLGYPRVQAACGAPARAFAPAAELCEGSASGDGQIARHAVHARVLVWCRQSGIAFGRTNLDR